MLYCGGDSERDLMSTSNEKNLKTAKPSTRRSGMRGSKEDPTQPLILLQCTLNILSLLLLLYAPHTSWGGMLIDYITPTESWANSMDLLARPAFTTALPFVSECL